MNTGKTIFLSGHGIPADVRIPQMCRTLPWRTKNIKFLLSRPVFEHGLRAVDVSTRVFATSSPVCVQCPGVCITWASGESISEHAGRCERKTRLAYLRRLCDDPDPQSTRTLYQRTLRHRTRQHGLRARFHDHRPVPGALPLGAFSKEQRERSSFTRFWTCAGTFRLSSILPTGKSTMSTSWTFWSSRPAFYIMDRGYIDFKRLYELLQALAFVVIRAKSNLKYPQIVFATGRQINGAALRSDDCLDAIVRGLPEQLRLVKFYDAENDLRLTFLTNNFALDALTIAQLYKCRWKVELFFKWIKQHLRIKAFLEHPRTLSRLKSGLPSQFTC